MDHSSVDGVRDNLPAIVQQLSERGLAATPVVFGDGMPQAVLISAAQFERLADALDDLQSVEVIRERERDVDINSLPLQSVEEVAVEMGVTLPEKS